MPNIRRLEYAWISLCFQDDVEMEPERVSRVAEMWWADVISSLWQRVRDKRWGDDASLCDESLIAVLPDGLDTSRC